MQRSRKFVFLLLNMLIAMFLFGCAAWQLNNNRRAAYESYVVQKVESFEYQTDFRLVWTEARQLLFGMGYSVKDSADPYILETEWRAIDNDTSRRYMVTGYPVEGSNRSRVQFMQHTEYISRNSDGSKSVSSKSGRDIWAERDLIKRVEPQREKAIEDEAWQYAYQQYPEPKDGSK